MDELRFLPGVISKQAKRLLGSQIEGEIKGVDVHVGEDLSKEKGTSVTIRAASASRKKLNSAAKN
jgi:hypothetical protein